METTYMSCVNFAVSLKLFKLVVWQSFAFHFLIYSFLVPLKYYMNGVQFNIRHIYIFLPLFPGFHIDWTGLFSLVPSITVNSWSSWDCKNAPLNTAGESLSLIWNVEPFVFLVTTGICGLPFIILSVLPPAFDSLIFCFFPLFGRYFLFSVFQWNILKYPFDITILSISKHLDFWTIQDTRIL